jgi:hypothetical protein
VAPARARGTSSGAAILCQRAWAAPGSLLAIAKAALRQPAPRVTRVLRRTLEKADSIGLVARRWTACSAGKS